MVSVFDWDNTVHKGYTIYEWIKHLLKAGYDVQKLIFIFDAYKDLYTKRRISHDEFAMKFNESYCVFFKDWSEAELFNELGEFIKSDKEKLFPFAIDAFKYFKAYNIPIIIVTGAPSMIVEKYKEILDIDVILGFECEIADGKLTGCVESNFGLDKSKTMKIIKAIYSGRTIGFGDSESDLPIINNGDIGIIVDNENLNKKIKNDSILNIRSDEDFSKLKSFFAGKNLMENNVNE